MLFYGVGGGVLYTKRCGGAVSYPLEGGGWVSYMYTKGDGAGMRLTPRGVGVVLRSIYDM